MGVCVWWGGGGGKGQQLVGGAASRQPAPPPPHAPPPPLPPRFSLRAAFEFSARHGLEWWQLDVTWLVISALQSVGLATSVKLPSERQKERLAFPAATQ